MGCLRAEWFWRFSRQTRRAALPPAAALGLAPLTQDAPHLRDPNPTASPNPPNSCFRHPPRHHWRRQAATRARATAAHRWPTEGAVRAGEHALQPAVRPHGGHSPRTPSHPVPGGEVCAHGPRCVEMSVRSQLASLWGWYRLPLENSGT